MEIREYYSLDEKEQALRLRQIDQCGWEAGPFLAELLREGRFRALCGETARVLLLTEGEELVSYCTLAERDDIQPTELGPWIGFVFTSPARRGGRCAGRLLVFAEQTARREGHEAVYISTCHTGLYEKYGYEFYGFLKDIHGEDSRVYRKRL